MSKPDDHDLRPRRRFSLWSLLAPAALVVVVIAMYTAINKSDVVSTKGSTKAKASSKGSKSSSTTAKHTCVVSRGHVVVAGETFGSIARKFCLSEETLKACNPDLLDPTSIQPGDRLKVGKKFCTKAAAAPSGVSINNL